MFDLKYHNTMKAIEKFHNDINFGKNKYNKQFLTKDDLYEEHYELMRKLDIDGETFSKLFIHMRINTIYFSKYPLSTLEKQINQYNSNAKPNMKGVNCMV